MPTLTSERKGLQAQLQSGTAHGRQPGESTLHEAELLRGQPLLLGRALSDSSKANFPDSFLTDSNSQAATLDCNDSGSQPARPSFLTEQQPSSMSHPNHRKALAIPPAPRRKLPQHTFPHLLAASCRSIAEMPFLDGISESSVCLCQQPYDCCIQSETITKLPQDAGSASMSALLAVAQPVSSADELLKRLQSGSIAATATTSNGHEQHSGNNVILALNSFKANHTGATARHVRTVGKGCLPSSSASMAPIETSGFHSDQEARQQPSGCPRAAQLVDNWLAQSHSQTDKRIRGHCTP